MPGSAGPLTQTDKCYLTPLAHYMVSASNYSDAEKGIREPEPFHGFCAAQVAEPSNSLVKYSAITEPSHSPIPLQALARNDRQKIRSQTNEREGSVMTTMVPASSLAPSAQKKLSKKKQASQWIQFGLWFNTYRSVDRVTSRTRS